MPIANPTSFHDEARYQRVCAACGRARPFHAHHVLYEQDAARALGVKLKDPILYDTRNALRLCKVIGDHCHFNHHNRVQVVETGKLTDENIAYAFEVLGSYAADYLRRRYNDDRRDPRIMRQEMIQR